MYSRNARSHSLRPVAGIPALLAAITTLLAACGGGGGGGGGGGSEIASPPPPPPPPPPPANMPPTADAGADQAVDEGATVQLAGQGSDPEGSVLTFQWSQVSGPAVTFADAADPNTTVVVPEVPVGNTDPVVLELRATDQQGASGTDTVAIDVTSTDVAVYVRGATLVKFDPETGATTPLSAAGTARNFRISPDSSQVVYAADEDTPTVVELYVVQMDGTGRTKISAPLGPNGDVRFNSFSWSPDGTQIAYLADADQNDVNEVFLVNADGSEHRKISGSVGNPAVVELTSAIWSPDGRFIAQTVRDLSTFGRNLGINTYDTQNPGSVRVSDPVVANGTISRFAWSPDSSAIAYIGDTRDDGIAEVFTSAPDGSGTIRVSDRESAGSLPGTGSVLDFEWNGDGSLLAYRLSIPLSDAIELYTVQPDGNARALLASLSEDAMNMPWSWAPDSSRIAYVADRLRDVFELFTVALDGAPPQVVNGALVDGGDVSELGWSPDSTWLAYVADQETDDIRALFVVRPDGTGNLRVNPLAATGRGLTRVDDLRDFGTSSVFDDPSFGWSPDGTRLVYRADQDTDGVFELYTVRPDAGENFKVNAAPDTSRIDVMMDFHWSADSSHLIFRQGKQELDPLFLDRLVEVRGLEAAAPDGMSATALATEFVSEPRWSE